MYDMKDTVINNRMTKIKKMIESLINECNLDEAKKYIEEYKNVINNDIDIYSMKAVIAIMENNTEFALDILLLGYEMDNTNFDILYNLAYVNEMLCNFNEAIRYYKEAQNNIHDENVVQQINKIISNIKVNNKDKIKEGRNKLVFFVKSGMDSFLKDIIKGLTEDYETRKIIVNDYNQIDEGMKWADICWFEWCDELVIYASNTPLACYKKVICRLHSYEAFTSYPEQVKWGNVDKFIVDTNHIFNIVKEKIKISNDRISIIPVGVDCNKFTYSERKKGYNIAFLGYINYKKGPMLLIQIISELVKIDQRYKLYIGGEFQDERDKLYFNQMIKELNIEENIIFDGWIYETDKWLDNKNYIISTSLLEGQHLSVMEGMLKGIKPIVHNFYGAKEVYDNEYVWNTIDKAVDMIMSDRYDSEQYKNYILHKYSNAKVVENIKNEIKHIMINEFNNNGPLVTIGIPNYNYSHYLDRCISSILNQDYKNVEIIIVDDVSTDDSRNKIIQYSKEYSNISCLFHENNSGGCLLAFNEVLEKAKGEFLLMLSVDDILLSKNSLSNMINLFDDNNIDYVYGNFDIIDNEDKIIGNWKYEQFEHNKVIQSTFERCGSGIMPLTAGVYRTRYFKENNLKFESYNTNKIAWDVLNTIKFIKNGWTYKYVNDSFIGYRNHGSNMTNNLKERITSLISNVEYIVENFKEEVYMPNIKWNELNDSERYILKNYNIINIYYKELIKIYRNQWNPMSNELDIRKEELESYTLPLFDIINSYIARVEEVTYENINEIDDIKIGMIKLIEESK